MSYAAALSQRPQAAAALDDVCAQALGQLGAPPDLAVVFFSAHHAGTVADWAPPLQSRLGARCLIGCSGESVVGNDREVELEPALSLWLARWSRPVELEPFHLELRQTPDGRNLLGWPDGLIGAYPRQALLLVLGDPFSLPVDALLQEVNRGHRGLRVVGGMASGLRGHESVLLLNDTIHRDGGVGVLLQGPVPVRTIVSQGCRPVGRHMVITRARDNVIYELGGVTPLAQLQQLWQELTPREQMLFQNGLHLGRVINEYQGSFQRGDFLVRNVLGLEQGTGALALNDLVRVGQTVQFHVRDGETADEDLRALLQLDLSAHEARPSGALLFTCNGRGTRLFPDPDHDARAVRAEAGAIPLAGFFAQGELGPVGGQNFIHGFTASVVLFEE